MTDKNQGLSVAGTFTLRPAALADVPAIVGLVRELATYENIVDQLTLTEAGLARYAFGPQPAVEAVVAVIGAEIIGFALFCTSFSTLVGKPVLYLDDLYVRPAYRGFGAGIALLRHLAQIVIDRDYGRLDWYVLKWNDPAIGFYKSLAAEEMVDWSMFQIKGEALARLATAL
jgi:GNAT superfamily N-acetyltransferase